MSLGFAPDVFSIVQEETLKLDIHSALELVSQDSDRENDLMLFNN